MTIDEGTNAQQADPGANPDTGAVVQPVTPNDGQQAAADERSQAADQLDLFAELPEDTREWLKKREISDPIAAAKLAHDQAKLLGNAIRVPGKNATEEERSEFLNKLGRPTEANGYEFAVPKDLPEELPYDAERATEFKGVAHQLGLTKEQAAGLHDWFTSQTVNDFKSSGEKQQAQTVERAKAETDKLVKLWGPLDGQTARTNLTYADKAITLAGGPEVVAELQRAGFIGANKEILSEPMAVMFAKVGQALFREDDILKGDPDKLNNPFAEGSLNVTKQMQLVKQDRDAAISLIHAAGKKPSEFGLKT